MNSFLFTLESTRSTFELWWFYATRARLVNRVKHGDGHVVLVIPGLGMDDSPTSLLREFLIDIGYDARPWGMGRNMGHMQISRLSQHVANLAHGGPVSIIGWSLGGTYARQIVSTVPDHVRQVITLGTPYRAHTLVTGAHVCRTQQSPDRGCKGSHVPSTAIVSISDGIVPWPSATYSMDQVDETIFVPFASHMGMCHNISVADIIADRLHCITNTWGKHDQ